MKKIDMFRRAVELLMGIPYNKLGFICDILEKIQGKETADLWSAEGKKFSQKKTCWTGVVEAVADKFLNLISGNETLTLDALDGTEILTDAKDVFAYIDSDFKNWSADEQGEATKETEVEVHELVKDATFSEFFGSACGDLNKLCFTQAQIKNFCVKHRGWLRKDGYATFFLFKSREQFFVALVRFGDGGKLEVRVHRFEYDCRWNAERRRRVVLPQLV